MEECPEHHADLEFVSGDYPSGVVAPDGVQEILHEEGYYCPRCDRVYDESDLIDAGT